MINLESILLALLVVDALALIGLILIQQGKGADVGAAFGSGSANTVFGGAGSASFMTKVTSWLAISFFILSFGLAYTAKERAASLLGVGIPTVVSDPLDAAPRPLSEPEDIQLEAVPSLEPSDDAGAPSSDEVPEI